MLLTFTCISTLYQQSRGSISPEDVWIAVQEDGISVLEHATMVRHLILLIMPIMYSVY